jgi:hypothetical protein
MRLAFWFPRVCLSFYFKDCFPIFHPKTHKSIWMTTMSGIHTNTHTHTHKRKERFLFLVSIIHWKYLEYDLAPNYLSLQNADFPWNQDCLGDVKMETCSTCHPRKNSSIPTPNHIQQQIHQPISIYTTTTSFHHPIPQVSPYLKPVRIHCQ